jgi:hypothetical protein
MLNSAKEVAVIHGQLEKRSLGRSLSTKALGGTWKTRYIVTFPSEIRWYERAEVMHPSRCCIQSPP